MALNSQEKNSANSEGFVFNDHTIVMDVEGLLKKIKILSDEDIRNYVNEDKNDFANWIKDSLKEEELALRLEEETSKEDIIRVIEAHILLNGKGDDSRHEIKKESFMAPQKEKNIGSSEGNEGSDKPYKEPAKNPESAKQKTYAPDVPKVQNPEDDVVSEEEAEWASDKIKNAIAEIDHVFVGQDEVVEKVMLCLVCDSHALLEGVPGLAKTLLVETLSNVISGTSFNRIQFLPDLLPSDIIGGQIYNPKTSTFTTFKGPIFANFVLADEVNRAPPKTHAALMECMQEKKVNIDKDTFILDRPFLVLATQNPLENKGTYALPEAILDRFMSKIMVDYPKRKDEKTIITENATTRQNIQSRVKHVLSKDELLHIQAMARRVFISERIKDYILDLVEATRGLNKNIEGFKFVKYGGGPRASIYLGIAARARALMEGRNYVLPDDVAYVSMDILRHRVCLNYNGKAHNISEDKIIQEILGIVHPV